jgi:hypothetical protein
MTAAGQSALNVQGSTRSVIDDVRFTVDRRARQERAHQAAPRRQRDPARWRVACTAASPAGRVFILSDRDIDFFSLKPTEPEFQLAGDSERVAITCADLGVDAGDLDAPGAARPDRLPTRDAVPRVARHHREGTAARATAARWKRCRSIASGPSCS